MLVEERKIIQLITEMDSPSPCASTTKWTGCFYGLTFPQSEAWDGREHWALFFPSFVKVPQNGGKIPYFNGYVR